eukprot:5675878-Pleurochrysis_carterae.AAC.8
MSTRRTYSQMTRAGGLHAQPGQTSRQARRGAAQETEMGQAARGWKMALRSSRENEPAPARDPLQVQPARVGAAHVSLVVDEQVLGLEVAVEDALRARSGTTLNELSRECMRPLSTMTTDISIEPVEAGKLLPHAGEKPTQAHTCAWM